LLTCFVFFLFFFFCQFGEKSFATKCSFVLKGKNSDPIDLGGGEQQVTNENKHNLNCVSYLFLFIVFFFVLFVQHNLLYYLTSKSFCNLIV
jgi:hypothetical protein